MGAKNQARKKVPSIFKFFKKEQALCTEIDELIEQAKRSVLEVENTFTCPEKAGLENDTRMP